MNKILQKYLVLSSVLLVAILTSMTNAALPPDTVIEQISEQMIAALKKNHEVLAKDPNEIFPLIDRILLPHFDVEMIDRMVLGKAWRTASTQQRQQFGNEFQRFVMNAYARQLLNYSDERLQVDLLSPVAQNSHQVTVHGQIVTGNAEPVSINYHLHMKNGVWKIYDITVEGVSLVINYRSSFAKEIRKGGLDALIHKLAEHNRQFRLEGSGNRE